MPEIREYENTVNLTARLDPGAQVREGAAGLAKGQAKAAGWEALGGVAAHLGTEWEKYKSREELSKGSASRAELFERMTLGWRDTAKEADPNDPTTGTRWRKETLDTELNAWVEGFGTETGKKWAEAQAASMREHFFGKTLADQATAAGEAAVVNYQASVNSAGRAAAADPTDTEYVLNNLAADIENVALANPNLTPDQVARIRGDIPQAQRTVALAGAEALAAERPELLTQLVESGKLPGYNKLTGDDLSKLKAQAERFRTAADADAKAAEAARVRQEKAVGDANLTRIYAAGLSEDGATWNAPPDAIRALTQDALAHPERYQPGEVASFVSAVNRSTEDALSGANTRTDPPTWDSLSTRIGRGLTKVQVDQAYAAKRLSKADWTFLRQAADGEGQDSEANIPGWGRANEMINEHLSSIRPSITKSNPMAGEVSPVQDARYGEYSNQLRRSILGAIKRGASADEAVEKYLNPNSKDYFGKLVRFYQVTPGQQEAYEDAADAGRPFSLPPVDLGAIGRAAGKPTVAPRQPGESAAAYLRRTGGG